VKNLSQPLLMKADSSEDEDELLSDSLSLLLDSVDDLSLLSEDPSVFSESLFSDSSLSSSSEFFAYLDSCRL